MTLRPDSLTRARTRSGIRISRRISPCPRHPDKLVTGVCASCLRERLSGLDAAAAADHNAASPELRRCRSVVSASKCQASTSSVNEPRRKSCDVVSARSSLCNLFDVDDLKGGSEGEAKVESKNVGKNVGLSNVAYASIDSEKGDRDEIRVSSSVFVDGDGDGDIEDGELKTMKEYIDLEFQNKTKKSKDLREIAGNLFGAASVFTKKLRNWRLNNNNHKNSSNCKSVSGDDGRKLGEGHDSRIVGRRSCDTEPRFSVDACQIPFEEPRASWDGYMIARSIPRLAPMFSVVENGILGSMDKFENRRLSVDGLAMHSIVEDESSSGASASGHSNSDSSSFMRRSSFDRSSSVRSFGKKVVVDYGVSPANAKQVITEKESKSLNMGSSRNDGLEKFESVYRDTEKAGNLNGSVKKSVRWRKVCNVFGFGHKSNERVCDTLRGNIIDDGREKKGKECDGHARNGAWKLTRSTSVVGPRNSCDVVESNYRRRSVDNAGGLAFEGIADFKVERNASAKYSSADLGDGNTPPFYLTPLRSLKHCKSGKLKLINPHSSTGNALQLN